MSRIIKNLFLYFCLFFIVLFPPVLAESVLEITENDFVIGDENASITIIEYASLSCSHCADFHLNTLPRIDRRNMLILEKLKIVFPRFSI